MVFEWDEAKSRRALEERGDYAAAVFADPHRLERLNRRRDYGEERRQTVGEVDGSILFVVYTFRGEAIRIISARRAHDEEERTYREGKTWE